MERIEHGELRGFTSAQVLSDTAHRMMTIEAMDRFGWPIKGLSTRLRKHPSEISKLTVFQQAIEQVPRLGIHVFSVTVDLVLEAANLSRQWQLLSGDAQILAAMQRQGVVNIASNDGDFDRVPWVTRFAPK